ncbi:PREDICTED: kinesin-like protein KIF13A [Gekko japonicus]|uniref:Kinesin-like protein KIF13A n=1 Tax=Gekko japonicus TaxID=146911 RepID=A0ABM1JP82_GEKJA|nr:PREDICTED: kinesin-like protein KIF13A [Gekko japonicus]
MSDTKVKVAVRVRPMNRRELDLNTKCIVEMEGNQTVLHPPPSNKQGENRYKGQIQNLHSEFAYVEMFVLFVKERTAISITWLS